HVSGTPRFWRPFLVALGDAGLPLAAVALGGAAVRPPPLGPAVGRVPPPRPAPPAPAVPSSPAPQPASVGPDLPLDEPESGPLRDRLIWAMERTGWVQAKAARLLGMTTRQVSYALRKYNIEIKRF
ncbi:helix-turn-helix domain-containing protein, partial [Azospirillum melinis]|uniref:helix-turn-helix domain-containing protein n=1 Tax=Azospirillum melinis TaxID=328839 RepID=UPI0024839B52